MKIAFTGTHGTGKTTSCYKICHEYKMQHDKEVGILSEIPRKCPFPINENASAETQLWIYFTHVKEEIEKSNQYSILICDRTIVDYLAYCYFINKELCSYLLELARFHINTYDKIYFKTIKNNDYLIDDGVRATDPQYRIDIENKLIDIYEELGYDIEYD